MSIIGIITDAHYANREIVGTRHYRDSIAKIREAISFFNERKPSFCVELGDLVDKGETMEDELGYLQVMETEYSKFNGDRHYVFGNHDFATLSKDQFLANCVAKKNYYSFDNGLFHFMILDACYNKDGTDYNTGNFDWTECYIPQWEQEWIKLDLQQATGKTFVFVHQRLDDDNGSHGIYESPKIRRIFEESGKVAAVFQGHDHNGMYSNINRIHYFTFQAMVVGAGLENNAYSLVHIQKDGSLNIESFGKQKGKA